MCISTDVIMTVCSELTLHLQVHIAILAVWVMTDKCTQLFSPNVHAGKQHCQKKNPQKNKKTFESWQVTRWSWASNVLLQSWRPSTSWAALGRGLSKQSKRSDSLLLLSSGDIHVEYHVQFLVFQFSGDTNILEYAQQNVMDMTKGLKHLIRERLIELRLFSWEKRMRNVHKYLRRKIRRWSQALSSIQW